MEQGLDGSLNDELMSMSNEVESIIDMSNLEPELTRWRHTKTNRVFMPTIEIFGQNEELLGSSGPIQEVPLMQFPEFGDKIKDLAISNNHLRVLTRHFSTKDSQAEWMQLAISLKQRDLAISSYCNTCVLLSPFLLLGLGLSGYLFARHATKPVEESFAVLRNFVADAGHELNTPIAILQANVEAVSENMADMETTLPIIVRTCERMSNLVKDLLFLARLESPSYESKNNNRTEIDLQTLGKDLYEGFTKLFEAKGLLLYCDSEPGLLINAEPDAIYRAVANLLKNALNYTESGSVSLKISKSKSSNHAIISVTDTGKGIEPESLKRIFDRFFRAESHRARISGTGLGLSIVKAIVENHGGSINVKSTLGSGSTFTIELPLV